MGWSEYAYYDRITVTAASRKFKNQINQLKIKGKMVIPVGDRYYLKSFLINKVSDNKTKNEIICNCVFNGKTRIESVEVRGTKDDLLRLGA